MKVLMFGWEYPPHVYGGLATANFGISQGLHAQGDVETVLCLPRPFGDEDRSACRIVAMNCVPIAWRDVDYDYVKSRVSDVMDPDYYYRLRDHIYADFNYMHVNDLGCMEFAGGYPSNLHEEINNYSIIAGVVARTEEFDIIHAHDWLTYPAGINAKHVSGKPLCIHVHATDFDRSRGKVNPTVYAIEKDGMDNADCIMCVSELTRQTVINQYHQDPRKCFTMHNAVYPLRQELQDIPRPDHTGKEKVVTFLGRITMQKGPEYFVEDLDENILQINIQDIESRIKSRNDMIIKIEANKQYNELTTKLTAQKFQIEQEIEILKDWIKLTDVNGMQSDIMKAPFSKLAGKMSMYLNKFFGSTDLTASFHLTQEANSFSFGIRKADDTYIEFDLLSSGEKCLYTLSLMLGLIETSNTQLPILLIDDLLDHLDTSRITSCFETLYSIDNVQVLLAGVQNSPIDECTVKV